jgi:TRAP-type C4-dicarboxylate transport system permease small subunit
VNDFFGNASIVFLFVLILSVAVQIVMRNMFSSGSAVIEELARFSLIASVFLMIPVLTLEKKQIIVDIVLMHLPASLRRLFDLVIHLVDAAFGVFILYAISLIMENNWNVQTPAMRMPNAVFYLPVFLGIALFTIDSVYNFACILKREGEVK